MKVGQAYLAVLVHEQVAWLNVTMNNAILVQVLETQQTVIHDHDDILLFILRALNRRIYELLHVRLAADVED